MVQLSLEALVHTLAAAEVSTLAPVSPSGPAHPSLWLLVFLLRLALQVLAAGARAGASQVLGPARQLNHLQVERQTFALF